MPSRRSPSLPTPKQIRDVLAAVIEQHPNARILCVSTDGVTFEYPETTTKAAHEWSDTAFMAANS